MVCLTYSSLLGQLAKYMVLSNHSNTADMMDVGMGWLHQPITPVVMDKVLLSLLGDLTTKLF